MDELNNVVFGRVPGDCTDYLSCDSISKSTDPVDQMELFYPPELLNSIVINNFHDTNT